MGQYTVGIYTREYSGGITLWGVQLGEYTGGIYTGVNTLQGFFTGGITLLHWKDLQQEDYIAGDLHLGDYTGLLSLKCWGLFFGLVQA